MQNKKAFSSRRLKYGSLATLITIGFLVALVLVNVVANLLLDRFPLNIDLTAKQIFALSDDSKGYVKELNQDVKLTVLEDETTFKNYGNQGNEVGDLYKQAYELLKNYTKYSSRITLEFVDPVKDPTKVKEYTQETTTRGDILVSSSLRTKLVARSTLFSTATDQNSGSVTAYRSEAEQNLTSAIMYVTDDNPVTVSLLTAQNGPDLTSYVDLLKSNNYSVVEQDLLKDEIDENASIVLLPQPTGDLSADQVKKLETFLDNDGRFGKGLVFVASRSSAVGPVLKNFLADWGVEVQDGFVLETDNGYILGNSSNSNYFPINYVTDETIKEAMGNNANYGLVSPLMRPVKTLFSSSGNRTVKIVASTTDNAVMVPVEEEEGFDINAQQKQAYPMITMTSRLKYDGTTPLTSYVVTIASEEMLSSDWMSYSQVSNGATMAAITETLAAKKNQVTILPLDISVERINITLSQLVTIFVILVAVVPLATLIAGVVIWLRRRHL